MEIEFNKVVRFDYVNWRGEKSKRVLIPKKLLFTSNKYHPEEQWMIEGQDLQKDALRTYTLKDIRNQYTIQTSYQFSISDEYNMPKEKIMKSAKEIAEEETKMSEDLYSKTIKEVLLLKEEINDSGRIYHFLIEYE